MIVVSRMRPSCAVLKSNVHKTFSMNGCKVLCNTSFYKDATSLELLKIVEDDIENYVHYDARDTVNQRRLHPMKKRNIILAIPMNNVIAVYSFPYPHVNSHTHQDVVQFIQSINPSGTILLESMFRSRARVTLMSI